MPRGRRSRPQRRRPLLRRKKKLIVAFHFQFANQAGWKCDACRKTGLEKKRRCGWIPQETLDGSLLDSKKPHPVWARRDVAVFTCPKSYITAESETLLEEYFVRKRLGGLDLGALSARQVEAFAILENAVEAEKTYGEQHRGTAD